MCAAPAPLAPLGPLGPPGPPAGAGARALRGTLLQVQVEVALADLLVVSCGAAGTVFRGVLLDCSKRNNLPFGVSGLHPAFDSANDKLYSANRRYAYQEPGYTLGLAPKPKPQQQRNKMTVRLRPRKVLCSKCKSICNENSENVMQTRKRKNAEAAAKDKNNTSKMPIMRSTLIPKISRLRPNEIDDALNGKYKNSEASGDSCDENACSSNEKSMDNEEFERTAADSGDECIPKRKRTTENIVLNNMDESSNSIFSNARTLKISFGEGEGTVVKLPASMGEFHSGDDPEPPSYGKAARRAMKKAMKKLRQNYARTSPDLNNPSSPACEGSYEIFPRKKHKVKHKKKKKDDKKNKVSNEDVSGSETPDENHSSIEELNIPDVLRLDDEQTQEDILGRVDSLDNNKIHFNKKKRGPYKEAVRLNTLEAGGPLDPLATDPLAPASNNTLTPLSSPPIDVLS